MNSINKGQLLPRPDMATDVQAANLSAPAASDSIARDVRDTTSLLLVSLFTQILSLSHSLLSFLSAAPFSPTSAFRGDEKIK